MGPSQGQLQRSKSVQSVAKAVCFVTKAGAAQQEQHSLCAVVVIYLKTSFVLVQTPSRHFLFQTQGLSWPSAFIKLSYLFGKMLNSAFFRLFFLSQGSYKSASIVIRKRETPDVVGWRHLRALHYEYLDSFPLVMKIKAICSPA